MLTKDKTVVLLKDIALDETAYTEVLSAYAYHKATRSNDATAEQKLAALRAAVALTYDSFECAYETVSSSLPARLQRARTSHGKDAWAAAFGSRARYEDALKHEPTSPSTKKQAARAHPSRMDTDGTLVNAPRGRMRGEPRAVVHALDTGVAAHGPQATNAPVHVHGGGIAPDVGIADGSAAGAAADASSAPQGAAPEGGSPGSEGEADAGAGAGGGGDGAGAGGADGGGE